MEKINLKTYHLYKKYGDELLWVSDSLRHKRPKDVSIKEDEKICIVANAEHLLELINNENYSLEMRKSFQLELDSFINLISKEVIEAIKKDL